MPPRAAQAYQEYQYRHHVIPGMGHDEYLDEPGDVIEWNTRIFHLEAYVQEQKQKAAR